MNLMEQVIAEVEDRGRATINDILPEFPDCTRVQVRNALSWARYNKRLIVIEDARGGCRGSKPSTYAPAPKFSPDETGWKRPVSFVFDLGRTGP